MGNFKKIKRNILLIFLKMGTTCTPNGLTSSILKKELGSRDLDSLKGQVGDLDNKLVLVDEVFTYWEIMPLDTQFNYAVKIIQNLPKEGPFQPSTDMRLKFYSLFKQATEGPCNQPKPPFYHVVNGLKWRAWKKLGTMSQDEAMQTYIDDLRQIVGTMPYTEDSENFLYESGLYKEYEKIPTRKYKITPPSGLPGSELLIEPLTPEELSQIEGVLPAKVDISTGSNSEDSSGGTDSFVICEAITENFENGTAPATVIENSSDTETEDEYSDPAETLDLPKYRSASPSGSAFYSLNSNQGVIVPLGSTDSSSEGVQVKESVATNRPYSDHKSSHGRDISDARPTAMRRSDSVRAHQRGLSADISMQLVGILQNIHQDLQAILVRLDTLENKSILTENRCSYCQRAETSNDISTQRNWWPFPELSPRSTFFLLLYPFLIPIAVKFFFVVRSARKLRLSMNQ